MASEKTPIDFTPSFPQAVPAILAGLPATYVPVALNGQTLEGILDEERIPNSLLPSAALTFASVPKAGTDCYGRAKRLKERFEGWLDKLSDCDPVALDFTVMQLIYSLHQHNAPARRNFAMLKSLPKHVATDRRDPIALIITAVQLLHDAVPRHSYGRGTLDIGRFAYVLDRLREAELVQVSPRDFRFAALKALSAFVAEVVGKHDPDCCFCVEVM